MRAFFGKESSIGVKTFICVIIFVFGLGTAFPGHVAGSEIKGQAQAARLPTVSESTIFHPPMQVAAMGNSSAGLAEEMNSDLAGDDTRRVTERRHKRRFWIRTGIVVGSVLVVALGVYAYSNNINSQTFGGL